MRKQTKLVAVLSATALLAIGATMTSFAADGWTDEGGTWVYYDADGDMVTSDWKKSGDDWYYLDEDGNMAVNKYIDSKYYVDENGKMLKNGWAKFNADDTDDTDPDSEDANWYYFGSNGSVTTNKWLRINGLWYSFADDGEMRYGWYHDTEGDKDNYFYLGNEDEGWATVGWKELAPYSDGALATDEDEPGADMNWYYFDSNGKAYKSKAGKEMTKKKIGSDYYYFNNMGVMQDGWYDKNIEASPSNASASNAVAWVYSDDNGHLITSDWAKLSKGYAKVEVDTVRDDSDAYLYFDSKGAPYRYKGTETKWIGSTDSVVKKVNGKYYFFDKNGFMAYGLTKLADGKYYYFGSEEDGSMKTGKITGVVENDDEKYTYYFITSGNNKGQGLTGIKDSSIYYHGKLVTAEEDTKYQYVELTVNDGFSASEAGIYLINESGKIQKSASGKKTENGNKYWTTSAGKIDTTKMTANDAELVTSDEGALVEPQVSSNFDFEGKIIVPVEAE